MQAEAANVRHSAQAAARQAAALLAACARVPCDSVGVGRDLSRMHAFAKQPVAGTCAACRVNLARGLFAAGSCRACFLRGHVPDPFAFACWRCLLDCGLLRPQPGSALRATQAHHGPPQLSSSRTKKLVHRRKAFAGHASGAQFFRSRSRSRPCAILAPSGTTLIVQSCSKKLQSQHVPAE